MVVLKVPGDGVGSGVESLAGQHDAQRVNEATDRIIVDGKVLISPH